MVARWLFVALATTGAVAINNGLGLTPPMGHNAYGHVGCCASEVVLKQQAQALLDTGLRWPLHSLTTHSGVKHAS